MFFSRRQEKVAQFENEVSFILA